MEERNNQMTIARGWGTNQLNDYKRREWLNQATK